MQAYCKRDRLHTFCRFVILIWLTFVFWNLLVSNWRGSSGSWILRNCCSIREWRQEGSDLSGSGHTSSENDFSTYLHWWRNSFHAWSSGPKHSCSSGKSTTEFQHPWQPHTQNEEVQNLTGTALPSQASDVLFSSLSMPMPHVTSHMM